MKKIFNKGDVMIFREGLLDGLVEGGYINYDDVEEIGDYVYDSGLKANLTFTILFRAKLLKAYTME